MLQSRTVIQISLVALIIILPFWFLQAAPQEAGGEGQAVYEAKCATCHGKDAKSATKAGQMTKSPDLTLKEWKSGTELADVEKLLVEGAGKMPKYQGKLSESEISAVAKYVRELVGIE